MLALREDGAGGLWAGGAFAGGNVAHFAADGTPLVDSPVTDGPVHALALDDGTVHLGGRFTRIQDAPRLNVGRVALVGGSVGAFNPRPTGTVAALAPLPGGGLAIGGAFGSTWDATTGGLAVFGDPPSDPSRPKVRPPPRRRADEAARAARRRESARGCRGDGARQRVDAAAVFFDTSANNDFALLEQLGGDTAGAISLVPPGAEILAAGAEVVVAGRARTVVSSTTCPQQPMHADEDGEYRLSLAGVQDKLPVVVRTAGRPHEARTPSTHILKTPI